MAPDDVIYNKTQTISRCIDRIREMYTGREADLESDFMLQDAVLINLQRAIQAAIDLATHMARSRQLGIPVHSADAFEMLELDGAISKELCARLVGMTGFRNIAVHEYQKIDMGIVRSILLNRLDDLLEISAIALKGN